MFRSKQLVCSSRDLRGPSLPAEQEEKQLPENGTPEITNIGDLGVEPAQQTGTESSPESSYALPSAETASEIYKALMAEVQLVFDSAIKGDTPDPDELMGIVKRAYDLLNENDSLLTETVRQGSSDTTRTWALRATNTAILSMRVGLEINYDERRSLALGLCALMHDIGMLTIPEAVLNSRSLTPQQLKLLRNHPLRSQKMVEKFGESFAWIGKVVVQVHERYGGAGYPRGLKGDQIHEFARIIGLADTYDAMSHPRADRKAHVTYNALSEIVDLRNNDFDPQLIKALIHIVSIFPLGSLVKLNNSEIGRVIQTNKLHSARPLIEILLDSQGRLLPTTRFTNLEDEPMLYIVDPGIDESVLKG